MPVVAVPFIAYFGSSNCRGLGTSVLEVSLVEWQRWFGVPFNLSGQGSPVNLPGPGFPIRGSMPSVKVYTPKLPYANNVRRPILVGGSGTTLDYGGAHVGAAADSWVFISKNSYAAHLIPPGPTGGQGNFRKIVSDTPNGGGAGIHRIVVSEAWAPAVVNDGEIAFLTASFCIQSIDGPGFRVQKTGAANWTVDQWKDRHVAFFGNATRRVASNDTDELVLDVALDPQPPVGAGFSIQDGAGSAETLGGLSIHAGGSFQPLNIRLDTAPVLLTGIDSSHHLHNQPGHSPGDLTCNAFPELMSQFRQIHSQILYGLCMGRDSATISPQTIIHAPALFEAWQKDLTQLDFNPSSPASMFVGLSSALLQIGHPTLGLLAQEGNTLGEVVLVILLAENDAQFPVLIDQIGAHMRTLRDFLRTLLGGIGVANPEKIKWIMVGPSSLEWLPLRDQVYTQLEEIQAEDLYSWVIDTRVGYSYLPSENPPIHFTTASQVQLGRAIFAGYQAMVERINAAPPPVDEPTQTATSLQEIVDILYKALAENAGVASYSINGRVVVLHGLDKITDTITKLEGVIARKKGIRRTLARFN